MGSRQRDVHYFAGASPDHSNLGHLWRLWSHETSFYLSARDPNLAAAKFSLHGSDPRPGKTPVFKFAPVGGGEDRVLASGEFPLRFLGAPASEDTRRVLRFRFRPQMYDGRLPSGRGFEKEIGAARGILVTAPAPGYVADLDFYVSSAEPRLKPEVVHKGAVVGPIANAAGQWLTGISHRRLELKHPTPRQAFELPPNDEQDAVRGQWIGTAGCSYAWVVETQLSRSALQEELSIPATLRRPRSQSESGCVASLARPLSWADERAPTTICDSRAR